MVFYVREEDGGHFGLSEIARRCGIDLQPIVFDPYTHLINPIKTFEQMQLLWGRQHQEHRLVMIGQSLILRTQPLDELVHIIRQYFPDVIVSYDASHVLGLIVGNAFPNPIDQGVDILHASTHKTFPGPQKAIIGFSPKVAVRIREKVKAIVSPVLQSNCGTSEIIALGLAFLEMSQYGTAYAAAVISSAQYLAHTLQDFGMHVIGESFGFTQTHQVWIAIGNEREAWEAFGQLHLAAIRTFPTYLPFCNIWGLRLGIGAMVRRGFQNEEIRKIACWIKQILLEQKEVTLVKNEVQEMLAYFSLSNLSYCFTTEECAVLGMNEGVAYGPTE